MVFFPQLFHKFGKSVIHLPIREMDHDSSFDMKEHFEDRKRTSCCDGFFITGLQYCYTRKMRFLQIRVKFTCVFTYFQEKSTRGEYFLLKTKKTKA